MIKLINKYKIFFFLFLTIFYFLNFNFFKLFFYFFLVYIFLKISFTKNQSKEAETDNKEFFDDLTGLYNLKGFFKFFNEMPIESFKYFILIDFLSLRRINKLYGHDFGDEILRLFSIRVKQILDYESVIARYENNKIIALSSGYKIQDLDLYIKNIQKKLNEPIFFGNLEVNIQSVIVLLESPVNDNNLDEIFYKLEVILKKAEKNMSSYEIYNSKFAKKHEEKLILEKELERAITNNELKAYYQPQIDISESKLIGFEALIRWENESLGILSPGKFIEIAEEQGLYKRFFYLILENVCKDIVEMKQHIAYDFKVSINISDIDLKESENLLKYIKKFLKKYELDGKYLELELTENFAINASEKNLSFFNEIKNLGINLVIDDFGIGYSSFSHLKNFPIDKIKLDKEFIYEIVENELAEKIVLSIVELSKSLNIDLLAEGIETGEQLSKLKELGCYKIQGYIFGKAIPCEKVLALLDEGFYQMGIDLLTKELEV